MDPENLKNQYSMHMFDLSFVTKGGKHLVKWLMD